MSHQIQLKPAAERQLARLRGVDYIAMSGAILALAENPRPPGARKLVQSKDLWRVRVRVDGRPWRIVYRLDEDQQVIVVTRVVRRDEGTYRRL